MGHAFTIRKYRGEDPHVHKPRMIYELLDEGKVVYTLYYPLTNDGEEEPQGEKTFRMKADRIIDRILASSEAICQSR